MNLPQFNGHFKLVTGGISQVHVTWRIYWASATYSSQDEDGGPSGMGEFPGTVCAKIAIFYDDDCHYYIELLSTYSREYGADMWASDCVKEDNTNVVTHKFIMK